MCSVNGTTTIINDDSIRTIHPNGQITVGSPMEAWARRAAIEAEMHHVGMHVQREVNDVMRDVQREMGRMMLGMGGWW